MVADIFLKKTTGDRRFIHFFYAEHMQMGENISLRLYRIPEMKHW